MDCGSLTCEFPSLQFVALEDSPLSGAARNIPDKPFELDPDWEVDPESLEIMEKIGVLSLSLLSLLHPRALTPDPRP